MGDSYTSFVRAHEAEWTEVAALIARCSRRGLGALDYEELEALAARHRRASSDFAHARTHYPGSAAETRLRSLVFAGHRLLAGVREPALARLLWFLRMGYPRHFRAELAHVGAALGIFLGASLLGFVVATRTPEFTGMFIGYEALEAVRGGHIWTDDVASMGPASLLSSAIFTNNISVALVAWASGLVFGLGTSYLLIFNGMMVGALVSLTWRFGLLDRLLAFISAHGPLELFLIIVAGGAGLILGRGTLENHNLPRHVTLARAGRRSLLLVAGTLPWFVFCGVIEGFLSPTMWVPTAFKAIVGLSALLTFLAYTLGTAPEAT